MLFGYGFAASIRSSALTSAAHNVANLVGSGNRLPSAITRESRSAWPTVKQDASGLASAADAPNTERVTCWVCRPSPHSIRQEAVTDAPHRLEVFADGAELFAQTANVSIDGTAVSMSFLDPPVAHQLLAGLNMPDALN